MRVFDFQWLSGRVDSAVSSADLPLWIALLAVEGDFMSIMSQIFANCRLLQTIAMSISLRLTRRAAIFEEALNLC